MFVAQNVTIGLFSFLCGIAVTLLAVARFNRSSSFVRSEHTADDAMQGRLAIESLMFNLNDLTADVREHVGNHSARIGAITRSIESDSSSDTGIAANAAKQLIEANHELENQLADAKSEIERQRTELQHSLAEARTDALTGLANRRAFDQELSRAIGMFRRRRTLFSLIILDIDHFKSLNDVHGHMVGDQVLKLFASCIAKSFRETDLVARFGGEEFVVLLPQTSLSEAILAAERARRAIQHLQIPSLELSVAASLGVTEVANGDDESEIIRRADAGLYFAKRSGRNKCCYHDGVAVQNVEVAVTSDD